MKEKEVKLALEEQWENQGDEADDLSEAVEEDPVDLRQKAKERDEYLDHLKRLKAEFENYRKRVEREKSQLSAFALEGFMSELLDVVDNLNRARIVAEQTNNVESYKEGVDMVFDRLFGILKRRGLERIPTVGEPFDPHSHEAILQDPRDDVPPNTVVEEITPGYRLHDRVLRAPRVKVSVAPTGEDVEATGNQDTKS